MGGCDCNDERGVEAILTEYLCLAIDEIGGTPPPGGTDAHFESFSGTVNATGATSTPSQPAMSVAIANRSEGAFIKATIDYDDGGVSTTHSVVIPAGEAESFAFAGVVVNSVNVVECDSPYPALNSFVNDDTIVAATVVDNVQVSVTYLV